MLCVALVHLQDWPIGEARDVDETAEDILGKLRAHYIAPLTRTRTDRQTTPPAGPPAQTQRVEEGPESQQASPQPARRARK